MERCCSCSPSLLHLEGHGCRPTLAVHWGWVTYSPSQTQTDCLLSSLGSRKAAFAKKMAAESHSRAGEGKMNPQAGLHSRCDINLYTNWWQTCDSWHISPLHIMSPIDFLFQNVSADREVRNWFSAGKMWQVQWGKLINECRLLPLLSS